MGEVLVNKHSGIKELTIVAGCQPDGSYIGPCIHIIYEVNDIDDETCLSDLITTVEDLSDILDKKIKWWIEQMPIISLTRELKLTTKML